MSNQSTGHARRDLVEPAHGGGAGTDTTSLRFMTMGPAARRQRSGARRSTVEGASQWLLRLTGLAVLALAVITGRPLPNDEADAGQPALAAYTGVSDTAATPVAAVEQPAAPDPTSPSSLRAAALEAEREARPRAVGSAIPGLPGEGEQGETALPRYAATSITRFARGLSIGAIEVETPSVAETALGAGLLQPKIVRAPSKGTKVAALGSVTETPARKSAPVAALDHRIDTDGRTVSCLPRQIKRVLNQVVAHFGPIRINSTYRSRAHNARVGGASRSLHLECRAVDFSLRSGRRDKVLKFLSNNSEVGGIGDYGWGGHIHIDDGPRRHW